MTLDRIRAGVLALGLILGPGAAMADTIQQSAIKDGCKKFYNAKTQKQKYRECIAGQSARSQDALIQGCYARYQAVKDKLRQCLGR